MNRDSKPYFSYMLRLWLENDLDRGCANNVMGAWRASLQDPHTQEMQVFANLEALFEFLRGQTMRSVCREDACYQDVDMEDQPTCQPT